MKARQGTTSNTLMPSRGQANKGFILPLVVIAGLILAVGGFAMLARSFAGLFGSIRQEQSRQAREIAETGVARTIELLNRRYSYLLINCYSRSGSPPSPNDCINTGTWTDPDLPSAICPGSASTDNTIPLNKIQTNPKGRYIVEYYAYAGTQFYGGTGKLKVIGERLSQDSNQVLATAAVETRFDVKPKPCDARFGDVATSSGFPGLLGWSVNLGNNDVKGVTSGNVLCILCSIPDPDRPPTQAEAEAAVGALANSDVDGKIFIGDISMPDVPQFPSDLSAYVTAGSITSTSTITASTTATTSVATNNNGGLCATDANTPPITHCLISDITLSGQKVLTVDTTNGPVRLYVSGDIDAAGKSGIYHDGSPARLGIFGNALSSDSRCSSDPDFTNQSVTLAGTSSPAKAANVFAYFPCATMGINGGAQATATCDPTGECGGGDVSGALWSKTWSGSSSNQAQLVVPKDMASDLLNYYGTRYAISIRDYVALGVNSWRAFEAITP